MTDTETLAPPVDPVELEEINKAAQAREELESILETGDPLTIFLIAAAQID